MAALLTHRRPLAKPSGPFVINRASPQWQDLVWWVGSWTSPSETRNLAGFDRCGSVGAATVMGSELGQVLSLNANKTGTESFTVAYGQAFTFAAWVYIYGGFACLGGKASGSGFQAFLFESATTPRWLIRNASGADVCDLNPTAPANQWIHLAGTAATGGGRVFINGQQAASGGSGTPDNFDSASFMFMGSVAGRAGYCAVADARLYRRALAPGEVAALYDPRTRWDLHWTPSSLAWVQLPAGGSTYNDTLSLASAAASAQAAAAIFGSALSLSAGATAGAAGPVTATHSLSLPSAAAVSLAAAHVLAEALGLASGASATPTSALMALDSLSLPTGATFTPAATHVLADTLSLATGATFTAEAVQTLLGTLTLSASAAQQAASTLIAASTLSLAAQAGLTLSAGAVTIDASLSLATAATFELAQTAVLGAVQTYAAAAGLTGSAAGVLGNALALDVLAALSSAPTGTYHPSLALAVAAVFEASHTYTGLYTYTVLKVAAEALRQAAATTDTLRQAAATTDTLTDAGVTGEDLD